MAEKLCELRKKGGGSSIIEKNNLSLFGRKVEKIYASDRISSDNNATIGRVLTEISASFCKDYVLNYKYNGVKRVFLSTIVEIYDTDSVDVETKIGTLTFLGVVSGSNKGLSVTINGTTTALYSTTSNIEKYLVEVIKLNDTLYLILYSRAYITNTYTTSHHVYARFVYLNASNVPAIGAGVSLGGNCPMTSTTSGKANVWVTSLCDDNSQILVFTETGVITDSTGAWSSHQCVYNNLRFRGVGTMGLRSTSWTSLFNNKSYELGYEPIQGLGVNTNFYNSTLSVNTYGAYLNIDGEWYGVPANDYSSFGQIPPYSSITNAHGKVDNRYVSVLNVTLDGYNVSLQYSSFIFDKATRKRLLQYDNASATITLNDSMIDGFGSFSLNNSYLHFVKIIDETLLIGLGDNNNKENVANEIVNPLICVLGFGIKISELSTLSFTYTGTCYGSTFRTDDLKNSLANNSSSSNIYSYLQEWLDSRPDYDYDYFRGYVIKYKN